MCSARLDPRLRDPRRRREVEKPQEILPEWRGVLLMADKENTKISRIADVTCRPAPPVPLPERVQVNKEFIKLDPATHQICIGLPFFELHKTNFHYHPHSEWSKFLDFMYKSNKFATVTCKGWQLFVQPPLEGPPLGFSSVRVHYRRETEAPMTESTDMDEAELLQGSAPSFQDWVSEPAAPAPAMELEFQEVSKRSIDPTAKFCRQPNLKRPRMEGVFYGYGNTSTDAPSSSQEKDLQGTVLKASEKPKSIGNCVTDISYEIPLTVDHMLKPLSHGNDNTVADKGKVTFNGVASEEQVPKPSSQAASVAAPGNKDWISKYVAEAAIPKPPSVGSDSAAVEKPSQASGSAQGGLKEKVPEMVIRHGATSGAAPANEDWGKKYLAEAPVPEAPSGGSDRPGAMGKLSEASGNAQGRLKENVPVLPLGKLNSLSNGARSGASGKEQSKGPPDKCSPSDMIALRKTSQSKEKLKDVQDTSSKVGVPIPTAYVNGDFRLQKGSQVAGKGKGVSNGGVGVSLKKQVPKQSSNDKGNIKKHIVHALPKVPDQFRVNLSSGGGVGASSAEQMRKPSSSASGVFQKEKCSQPETRYLQGVKEKEPKPILSSNSFEKSAEQKSSKVAVKLIEVTDAPSSSSDKGSQKTRTFRGFSNGVRRSKPQKIKFKKSSSSEDEGSTSSDTKKRKNGRQHWLRVIENILELIYLADDRNATEVDVGVEEVEWRAKKRNVVTITIGDNGEGMSSREVAEFFDLKIQDIPADNLVFLTKTKKEQPLVGFFYQNDFKCLSYSKYDREGTTSDVAQWSMEKVLETIESSSPFNSTYIKSELTKLGTMGTRIIVYRYGDLVFNQPQQNLKVEDIGMKKTVQSSGQNEDLSQLTNGSYMKKGEFIETLCTYVQAMYVEPQVIIQVQNIIVNKSLREQLSSGGNQYYEMMDKKEIILSLSFDKAYSRSETYGICLYYRNRLLEGHIFLKVGKMDRDANYGRGVVGVVDITSLMDYGEARLHRAQIDFERNKHYNMLMKWLADMVHEYCDNRDLVKNGGRRDNIYNSPKVYFDEKISKVVGNGKTSNVPKGQKQEAKDVLQGKTGDLKGVTSTALRLPKIGEISNSKTVIRCSNCRQWRELPFGIETEDFSGDWNCNMLPFNGSCNFPDEDTAMDIDDGAALSKLMNFTPCPVENNADGLANGDTDYEPENSSIEYEVEKIIDVKLELDEVKYYVKWVGYCSNDNTWEPAWCLRNAPKMIQEYFYLFPSKKKEIFAKKVDAFEVEDEVENEDDYGS